MTQEKLKRKNYSNSSWYKIIVGKIKRRNKKNFTYFANYYFALTEMDTGILP